MEERRKYPRSRVLKSGRIAMSDKGRKIDCTVRNLSPVGACVELPSSTFGIPQAFTLMHAGGEQPCRVIWRTEQRMGLAFVEKQRGDARSGDEAAAMGRPLPVVGLQCR